MIMALHRKNGKSGLSIIEVMVAIFLISIALASTLPILYRMIRYTRAMKLRSKAVYLADKQMEKVRSWPIYQIDYMTGMSNIDKAQRSIHPRNPNFWDYELFTDPGAPHAYCLIGEGNTSKLSCTEWLIPKDIGVVFTRRTWLIRNGNVNGVNLDESTYDCSPVLFGAATGDFQQAASSDKLVSEGSIYMSNGTQFSTGALANDGITGACSTASLNAWASYRWADKRRFVRYDSACGGSYPYRGEDFVLLEVDVAWSTRIAGHAKAQTVEREITRSSIIRGR